MSLLKFITKIAMVDVMMVIDFNVNNIMVCEIVSGEMAINNKIYNLIDEQNLPIPN